MERRSPARKLLTTLALTSALLVLAAAASSAQAAPISPLGLMQLPAPSHCFSNADPSKPGDPACTPANGLPSASGVVVSPDGLNVYTYGGTYGTSAIAAFSRSTTTGPTEGALTQLPEPYDCISMDIPGGTSPDDASCQLFTPGVLGGIDDLAISPDGKHVYAALGGGNGIDVFERETTPGPSFGSLDYSSCIREDGSGSCNNGNGLKGVRDLTVSPDGKHVYAVGIDEYGALAALTRDETTGELTQKQCITENNDPTPESGCANTGRGIGVPFAVAISPDGASVYVGSYGASDGVAAFTRDTTPGLTFGEVTQIAGTTGCISEDGFDHAGGTAGLCADGRGLVNVVSLAVSPDGKNVYSAAFSDGIIDQDAISILSRDTGGNLGALSQANDSSACLAFDADGAGGPGQPNNPECSSAVGTMDLTDVIVSPDGRSVVTSASGASGGVAIFERATTGPVPGQLTQLTGSDACLDAPTNSSSCADANGISGAVALVQSLDGKSVYTGSYGRRSIGVLLRGAQAPSCSSPALRSAGKAMTIKLGCTDANADTFNRTIASGPANGSLGSIDDANGSVVYTPKVGYNGADSFTYLATDWSGSSSAVTVTINPGVSVSSLKVKRSSLKVGSKRTKIYTTVSDAARVKYTIARPIKGRLAGKKCSAKRRTGKRCTLYKTVASFSRKTKQGKSSFKFNGRIKRRVLAPGRYRITAVATTSDGLVSPGKSATFTIMRR
jgi:hypothetical protein